MIQARSTPRENEPLDVECRLEEDNGIPANSYSWAKYPSLPRTARVQHNRLSIERFEHTDNGLYTCRASTDENDYERVKLLASNDYLLGANPFFKLTRADAESIEVKCRPDSDHSTYTWRAVEPANNDDGAYVIQGDRLVLYESAASQPHTFACQLNTDSEFGPISIELDVNQELIEHALGTSDHQAASGEEAPARLYVDEHRDEHNSFLECQPGENC